MIKILLILFFNVILICAANENIVARVIYAEAGPNASTKEMIYVASVIKNRINNKAFGNKCSMYEVVIDKNQFSALNDVHNINWVKSKTPDKFTKYELRNWKLAVELSRGLFEPPNPDIVYFLSSGTSIPNNWFKYYNVIKVISTDSLDFYLIRRY